MSASPAGHTPGQTPNGGPLPPMRRPKKADPMVRPKKRGPKPVPSPVVNGVLPNGPTAPPRAPGQIQPQNTGQPKPQVRRPVASTRPNPLLQRSFALLEGSELTSSGFSSPTPIGPYQDFPLVTTKRALKEGLRHHVLRFASKRNIDVTDENQFLRPVRLHRRDPRHDPSAVDPNGEENEEEKNEREKREKAREEREKQKEIDAVEIAPSADKPAQRKVPFGKKVQPVYSNNQTQAQKEQSKLKYEETLPWHLEDDENKNIWIGNYEQALSREYAALVQGPDGKFRMIPLEKWYRFTSKNKLKVLDLEEAEKKMLGKSKRDKLDIKDEEAQKARQEEAKNRIWARGRLFGGKTDTLDRGSGRPNIKTDVDQVDDLDFEEDRFADDEEAPFMEGAIDAEEKEVEKRVKKEQLEANVFDMRDEQDYDAEEEEQQELKQMLKQAGKKIRKTMVKREKNFVYEQDDSDRDPFSESVGFLGC